MTAQGTPREARPDPRPQPRRAFALSGKRFPTSPHQVFLGRRRSGAGGPGRPTRLQMGCLVLWRSKPKAPLACCHPSPLERQSLNPPQVVHRAPRPQDPGQDFWEQPQHNQSGALETQGKMEGSWGKRRSQQVRGGGGGQMQLSARCLLLRGVRGKPPPCTQHAQKAGLGILRTPPLCSRSTEAGDRSDSRDQSMEADPLSATGMRATEG